MKKTWLLLPIAASQCVMPLVSCSPTRVYDYEEMISSYRKMLLETIDTTTYEGKTPQQIRQELDIEHETKFQQEFDAYYFKDIVYESDDPAIWPAHQHIVRTLQIAIIAYRDNNAELMDIANKLTGYWLCHDYENPNWWFNMIGVPRDFSNLAIFVINNLPSDQQASMLEWIHHGSLKYNKETLTQTGTNMFWVGDITMKSGLLAKDNSELDLMYEKVFNEIVLDNDEGFQSDGSYFQHGHQLYTGGYGRQGALLLAKIVSAFVNSDIKLDEKKIGIIVNFALDGMKYFTFKKNFNWQCMGRTYTRKQAAQYNGGTTDLGNIAELRYFAQLPNCPRKDELNQLLDDWDKGKTTFTGVKYFEKSRFLATCIDDVYIGFKGTNSDLVNSEIANGENIIAHNLVFGVNTCVMQTGEEYADIAPLWNYSELPGTSAYVESDEELEEYDNDSFKNTKLGTFYGGFNKDEQIGFVSQNTSHKLHNDKTEYLITGFATPYGLAVLGNNVTNDGGKQLTTTIQQCIKKDDDIVTTSSDNKTITHNNVIYSNIEDSATSILTSKVDDRNCSWHRNNHTYLKDDTKQGKVLTIQIDNSNRPQYAYSIQPKAKHDIGVFEVAKNDEDAQAILMPNGKIACIFYKDNVEFTYKNVTCIGNKGEFKIFSK